MEQMNLLIIDTQNDFCDPRGSLYVQGALEDSSIQSTHKRHFYISNNNIYITLDSHHNYDIAHPLYWIDGNGNHPDPFTIISSDDIKTEKWKTTLVEDRAHGEEYVRILDEAGKYSLCIWPPHCLIGSWGTQIQEDVYQALSEWEIVNISKTEKIFKGDNPGTEHYGAFEAEIPLDDDPSTQMRSDIAEKLKSSDRILIAGQALDYCVANSVRQVADVAEKIFLLDDCCSSVDPSSGLSEKFLQEMKLKGMKIIKSTEL